MEIGASVGLGLNQYGYNNEEYVSKVSYLNNTDSIDISWIDNPTPYSEFKAHRKNPFLDGMTDGLYVPNFMDEPKCPELNVVETLGVAFVEASQGGYKTAGFKKGNLKGMPASRCACEADELGRNVMEIDDKEYNIGYELVNTEKARYQYGYQDSPPNMGANLPGSDSLLQKDPYNYIRAAKRAGNYISGSYAGYQSQKTSINGYIDNEQY